MSGIGDLGFAGKRKPTPPPNANGVPSEGTSILPRGGGSNLELVMHGGIAESTNTNRAVTEVVSKLRSTMEGNAVSAVVADEWWLQWEAAHKAGGVNAGSRVVIDENNEGSNASNAGFIETSDGSSYDFLIDLTI